MIQFRKNKKNNTMLFVSIFLVIIVLFFIIYTSLKDQYTIKLIGDKEVIVYLNENYSEPGYYAYDKNNNDVTREVKISGDVNTKKEGTYKVIYEIGNVKEYRIVIVKYNPQNDITFNFEGDKILYILKNNNYDFKDCQAIDKIDGNITSKIVIKSEVDFNNVGEYEVEYSVVNSRNIKKSIKREVIIYDIDYTLTKNIINNKLNVSFNFDNKYYQKVKLPNGSFVEDINVNYTFIENGEYVIEVYDKYGYVKKITLKVSEIDNIMPTGSCTVNLYDNTSSVIVNANDNQGIKGYIYKYGSKISTMLSSNEFSYSDMTDEVKVTIYDKADNSIDINCNIKDLSTHYPRSYTTEYATYNYKLYIPSILTKRNKLPLVIFLHGSGECGSDISKIEVNSFPKYIKDGADFDFVLIAPQIPSNACQRWSFKPNIIKDIIDEVVSKYPIDPNRIIITGFSLGAISTYNMIKTYPTFFAGAMPVAGYTEYDDSLLKTDIWAFHGTNDSMYDKDKKVMDKVVLGNSNSKFTVYNASHNITNLVYKDPNAIEWIVNKRRK